jgi:hypothetical protein
MATMAASSAATLPRAEVVGNAFVEQYYHILHLSPEMVYKFYQDSSVLSRPDSHGMMTSVTTMQAINEKIQSLDYKSYKAEIETADAQESYKNGVTVLVTGCLTGTDNIRRKFTQTFFLAPQENGYFVLNDIFRYVRDETEQLKIPSESIRSISNGSSTAELASDPVVEPTRVPDNPASDNATNFEFENLRNSVQVYDHLENKEESVHEDEDINEPSSQNDTGVSELSPSKEKKSYASIVKVYKVATSPNSVSAPAASKKWTPTNNANQQLRVSAKPSPEPQLPPPTIDSVPDTTTTPEEVEGFSVYVKNLPVDVSIPQLEEAFKKFGPIKNDGVQVKSNKQQGFCFGFVEFESLDSMQNAVKESRVMIGDRQAAVEEKRATNRVLNGSGRGRFMSGRGGGFRNGNYRGRGGEFSNRGGYGRSQGGGGGGGEFSGRQRMMGPTGRHVESYRRVDQNGNNNTRFNRQPIIKTPPIEA